MRTPKGKIKRKIMKGWVSSLFDEFCLSQKKRSKGKDFYWSAYGAKEKMHGQHCPSMPALIYVVTHSTSWMPAFLLSFLVPSLTNQSLVIPSPRTQRNLAAPTRSNKNCQ